MPDRLLIADKKLFPVQAFFNSIGDREFVHVIEHLLQGIGAQINDADCSFTEGGIKFSLYEDEIVVNHGTFLKYLRNACGDYLSTHPEDRGKILDAFQKATIRENAE